MYVYTYMRVCMCVCVCANTIGYGGCTPSKNDGMIVYA